MMQHNSFRTSYHLWYPDATAAQVLALSSLTGLQELATPCFWVSEEAWASVLSGLTRLARLTLVDPTTRMLQLLGSITSLERLLVATNFCPLSYVRFPDDGPEDRPRRSSAEAAESAARFAAWEQLLSRLSHAEMTVAKIVNCRACRRLMATYPSLRRVFCSVTHGTAGGSFTLGECPCECLSCH